jgi:copper oxidase (laccase) domain-containing protein
VHAGWRGTVARTAQAALTAMCSLGARPEDVVAGIGPSVAADSYQVGEEVAGAARDAFGQQAQALLRPAAGGGPGQWLFDLPAANRHVLRTAGVPDGQIHVAATPTGPGPGLFFSHRAERPCGRFALAARLEPREQR